MTYPSLHVCFRYALVICIKKGFWWKDYSSEKSEKGTEKEREEMPLQNILHFFFVQRGREKLKIIHWAVSSSSWLFMIIECKKNHICIWRYYSLRASFVVTRAVVVVVIVSVLFFKKGIQ